MQDIYIGRQPIFDRNLNLFAYELLYRANNVDNSADIIDHDHATTNVLVNAFLDFGLEELVGRKLAFINLPRNFIVGEKPLPLPKDKVILEILEGVKVDEEIISAVRKLRGEGYGIALDDFIYHPDLEPLVRLSKIVKIDFVALSHDQIREHVAALSDFQVELLAEKVETQEDFELAKELGFRYFQGHFLCTPQIVSGRSLPSNRLAIVRLLAEILDPNKKISDLAELVSQDVALSFKLLRTLNSPFYALPKRIDSIHRAIVYLGLQQIKQWVSLIVLANVADKPSQLMVMALTRAKMCELIGEMLGEDNKGSLFTVGMFSLLDALMDANLETILVELPLAPEVKAALLNHEGTMGRILNMVMAYENGQWDAIDYPAGETAKIIEAYLQAVTWTDQVSQQI